MSEQMEFFAPTLVCPSPTAHTEELDKAGAKRQNDRRYYEKNRERLRAKAKSQYRSKKESQGNVIPLFGTLQDLGGLGAPPLPPPPPPVSPSRPKKQARYPLRFRWSTVCLQALVFAIFYFIVTETAAVFALTDQTTFGPYLKAILLDGSAQALSLIRPKSLISGVGQALTVVLLYAYTIWLMSGNVYQAASLQRADGALNRTVASELETEIGKSIALRDRYLAENRITLGKRTDETVSTLRIKLEAVRLKILKIPDTEIIWNTLFTLIAFRILVVVSSLFCLAELKVRYRAALRHH